MKNITMYIYMIGFLIFGFLSCSDPFEFDIDLGVNQGLIELPSEAGATNVMVYSKSEWTVKFKEPVNWASLEEVDGKGNGTFKIRYTENFGGSRTVTAILQSGSKQEEVQFKQAQGVDPTLAFFDDIPTITSGAYATALPLKTNLKTDLDKIEVLIQYTDKQNGDWIQDYEVTRDAFMFNTVPNPLDKDRKALIRLKYVDAYDQEAVTQCILTQSTEDPRFIIEKPEDLEFFVDSASYTIPYLTNLQYNLVAITPVINYKDGQDWIEDINLGTDGFEIKLLENESNAPRLAIVNFTLVDLNGTETILESFEVLQTVNTYEELTFEELRAMIPGASGEIEINEPYKLLIGYITSIKGNMNLDMNPNTSQTAINWSENNKTAYIQNEKATYGFRLKTSTEADNVFERGDKTTLILNNVVLVKESNPERYTIKGVTPESVKSTEPSSVAFKSKRINELTDADIYTEVTLKDVEFAVKNGSYTNVHEGYTWGGIGTMNISGSANSRGVDCAPRALVDKTGSVLNMLVNMRTPWRRIDNNGIPKGSGTVTGILVHDKMIRYAVGGDIGRYQIRPMLEENVIIEKDIEAGNTGVIAEWNWDSNVATAKAEWTPDISNGSNAEAKLRHSSISSVTMRPDFNSEIIYYKNNTAAGSNNPTGQTTNIEGYIRYGAAEYRGVYWNYDTKEGEGFIADFSTSGVSSQLLLAFTIAGGDQTAGATNYFPTYWHVEYSTDGGATYMKVSDSDFTVRPIGWWSTLPLYSMMGLSEQVVLLPSELSNKSNVSIKIVPSSSIGLTGTGATEQYGNVSATTSTYVRLGTVSVKYYK